MIVPGIADGQFMATPSGAQNTGEQGISALGRATGFTALSVVLDHRPDRLGLLPIDINPRARRDTAPTSPPAVCAGYRAVGSIHCEAPRSLSCHRHKHHHKP